MTMNPCESETHTTAEDKNVVIKRAIAAMHGREAGELGQAFNEIILNTVRAFAQQEEARVQSKLREPEKLATAQDMDVVVRMAAEAVHEGAGDEVFRLMGRVFNEIILDTVRIVVQGLGEQWLRATSTRIPPTEIPELRRHLQAVADDTEAEHYLEAMKHLAVVFNVVPDHTLDHIGLTLIGAGLRSAYEKQAGKEREQHFKNLVDRAIATMGDPGGNAEAIACLEEALKLVPDPPVTEHDRSRCKRVLDGLAVVRAAGIEPTREVEIDWVERGSALLDRDLAEALACFEKACALKPEDGGGWAGRAGVLRSLGRYDEAIQAYDRLIALVPGEADFWFERADCLENVNRLDEALTAYERTLQIEPDRAPAWADRGHVLQRLGRRQEALASNVKATECDPQLFIAWLNRAELERVLEMPAAAESYQRFLATVPPGQQEQLVQRARTQLAALAGSMPEWQRVLERAQTDEAAGKVDEAEALFRRVVELHPPIAPQVLHNMGVMLMGAGRIGPALQCYREALTLAPNQVRTWGELGSLFRHAGRVEQAIAAYHRQLALAPADIAARLSVARLFRQQGKFQAALDELKLAQGPHPEVLYLQGSCLLGLGQFAEALALLEQVPADHPDGLIDRGICLERLHRKPEALACYERGHPLSGRHWFHLARCRPDHAAEYLARAVELLLAYDRQERLDPMAAAELAHARKRLAELDRERAASLDADDLAQRNARLPVGP